MPSEFPAMNELLREFFERRSAAHAAGLVEHESPEVEPYEAVPAQALDPAQAWNEAMSALVFFGLTTKQAAPEEWPQLVGNIQSAVAVPFAAGHFPQAVRDLQRLARTVASLPADSPQQARLLERDTWIASAQAGTSLAEPLVAAGIARLAGDFATAERLLDACEKSARDDAKTACANERGALRWAQGFRDEAAAIWRSLPDSAPVLFNRGLAALFAGDKAEAQAAFSQAVEQISESSGWHHLGRLYLSLAQS